jgi:hypothetical protein
METDDGKRSTVGVVVSLLELDDGTSRIILDDVRSDTPQRKTSWEFDRFYAHKRLDSRQLQDMALPEEEYRGLGISLLTRLLALKGRAK